MQKVIAAGLLLVALAGCGGGSGSSGSSSSSSSSSGNSSGSTSMTSADTARLLEQATFGPTPSEVARVAALGFNGYMQEQLATPATGYSGFTFVPHTPPTNCQSDASAPTGPASICARDNYSLFQVQRQFFENALNGPDQLRQRVAFALSQIFVVSGTEIYEAYGMAAYQNVLLNDAFVNFRQLLEDVTLSPVMGNYLNMAQNQKYNPTTGTPPNENYAREVMQLFSIGVNELNPDGSLMLDANSQPIPNYNQGVIEGFSAVFTGWTYPPQPKASSVWTNPINYQGTMVSFPNYHDSTNPKLLLNGVTLPAGQTPEADLEAALDLIFNHPNVGPFIGKQLIQHLVTSNPSPAYVARVAAVFANNGQGVRGDMAAVVQAILGDVEARGDAPSDPNAGHLREPALYITTVLRALGGQSDGVFPRGQITNMGQPLFTPPTVFNFYPPGYELPGSTTLAPEFFIQTATTALARVNFVNQLVYGGGAQPDPTVSASTGTTVNLGSLVATSESGAALVDQLNTQLMHGSLSSDARNLIVAAVNAAPTSDPLGQVKAAAYLLTTSSQFQVEH